MDYEHAKRRITVFLQATNYEPQASFQTPTPTLPEGEGALLDAGCEPWQFCQLRTIIHKTTNYKPLTTCRCFVIPAKRAFGSR